MFHAIWGLAEGQFWVWNATQFQNHSKSLGVLDYSGLDAEIQALLGREDRKFAWTSEVREVELQKG